MSDALLGRPGAGYQAGYQEQTRTTEIGRVAMAVHRLAEANMHFDKQMDLLQSVMDRLCGGVRASVPTSASDTRSSLPDMDELDNVTQSICDRVGRLGDLVQRATAL